MESLKSKIGRGSLSMILLAMGIGFSITFSNGMCIGDYVLKAFGLSAWSEGNTGIHYTLFYSMIFLLPAWYLGSRYHEDYGAQTGKSMSLIFITLIIAWFLSCL